MKGEIKLQWGIVVVDRHLSRDIVPLVTRADRPVTMVDASNKNETACLKSLIATFSKYPKDFISRLVSRIALADRIEMWSIRTGGFQIPQLLALNCDYAFEYPGVVDDNINDAIAVLMLAKASPDFDAWTAFNPPGFVYGDTLQYQAALRDPDNAHGSDALSTNGFVSAFGETGFYNDIATVSENLIGHSAAFAVEIRRYPRLRGKARLLMAVFLQQAPGLKSLFDKSGLTTAVGSP